MRKNFLQYLQQSVKDFIEAAGNLFIFLPYFFSVSSLVKTFFYPWKNLIVTKKSPGFQINEWIETVSFNLISQAIGMTMRFSIILFYFLILVIYLLLLPIVFIVFLFLVPFFFIKYSLNPTDSEKESALRKKFINDHLYHPENYAAVYQWSNLYLAQFNLHRRWWKLANLTKYPPLARDWAVGYTPILDQYTDDLCSPAYQVEIKAAYDREKEISQIERILSKSDEANVVIVGEEDVGKHTIIDSLAKKIYEGQVNNILAYKRVLKLNLEKILNQSTDQKQRENIFENLLAEAAGAKNIILLIENFDKYVASGVDRVDLSIPIEKYAKTNRLHIIAITQPFFYQKFIFANERISHLFTKVDVYEISKNDAETILLEKAFYFEKKYRLIIPYETIKNVIDKSDYFITHIPFPEKALSLLDSACVLAQEKKLPAVSPDLVDKVLSEITHIPTTLTTVMKKKLINLESELSQTIIQQEEAAKKVASALRRSFLLIGKRKNPMASFLFLGPTGVGKTETAKTIARIFFGSEKYLLRFDMSLYQRKEDIPNLIGSLENNNPGLLTSAIRQKPYGVLLLDEIEKASKDLINIFLTITDEGYFTDGFGKRVDCKNLVIIATSNAGSEIIFTQDPVINNQQLIDYLITNHIFSPEFLNRFDGVILFQPLSKEAVIKIAKKYLIQIASDIDKLYQVKLQVSDQFLQEIVNQGYSQKFGARNLYRVIREEIEDRVAKIIFERKIKSGETLNL